MRMTLDDDLNKIEGRFLGTPPPLKITLPFQFRYKTYGIFFFVFTINFQIISRILNLNIFFKDILTLGISLLITYSIAKHITPFTPLQYLFEGLVSCLKRNSKELKKLNLTYSQENIIYNGDYYTAWFSFSNTPYLLNKNEDKEALILEYAKILSLIEYEFQIRIFSISSEDKKKLISKNFSLLQNFLKDIVQKEEEKIVCLGIKIKNMQEEEVFFNAANKVSSSIKITPFSSKYLDYLIQSSLFVGVLPSDLNNNKIPNAIRYEDLFAKYTEDIVFLKSKANQRYHKIKILKEEWEDLENTGSHEDGEGNIRYASILSIGVMAIPDIPEKMLPWLAKLDQLPFTYQVSVNLRFMENSDTKRKLFNKIRLLRNHISEFNEHSLPIPNNMLNQIELAETVEEELNMGLNTLNQRLEGNVLIALTAKSPKELSQNIEIAKKLLSSNLELILPFAQELFYYNFLPISKRTNYSYYKHQFPLITFAGSFPLVGSKISDKQGLYLGFSEHSKNSPIFWDIWKSVNQEQKSGFSIICGDLGSGKSALAGSISIQSILNGEKWIILDPYGHLKRLKNLDLLKEVDIKIINLSNSVKGFFDPFLNYTGDKLYNVVFEFIKTFYKKFSYGKLEEEELLEIIFKECKRFTSMEEFLQAMSKNDNRFLKHLANSILTLKDSKFFNQWISDGKLSYNDTFVKISSYQVIIVSLEELLFARNKDGDDIETSILNLTYKYIIHYIIEKLLSNNLQNKVKGILIDEAHGLLKTEEGYRLLQWIARDSRKQKIRSLCLTQNPSDFQGFSNFLDYIFIGRLKDQEECDIAADLCNMNDSSIFKELSTLNNSKNFIVSNRDNYVENINIDLSYSPNLLELFR